MAIPSNQPMRTPQKPSRYGSHTSPAFTLVELLIVIIVIAILAAITTVAYNGVTDQARSSAKLAELSQWKKKSELHKAENSIECPPDYVFVYGNSTLGTSDFCVMKYEAKIQGNDDGTTAYASSMVAESRATGTPWANISQTNAITEGNAACTGCHLITDAEWMTIAADVLSVEYNWSGGAVGSGYIYSGHNDNAPANALAATNDDTDSYNGTGNSATTGPNQKRTLYLTSGDVIWDFPGNVWEWTSQAQTMNQVGVSGDTGFNWRQWNLGSLSLGNLPNASKPSTLASMTDLSGVTGWSSSNGVGQIFANYADTSTRGFRHGGGWNDGGGAGVLALRLNFDPSNYAGGLGFRVAR